MPDLLGTLPWGPRLGKVPHPTTSHVEAYMDSHTGVLDQRLGMCCHLCWVGVGYGEQEPWTQHPNLTPMMWLPPEPTWRCTSWNWRSSAHRSVSPRGIRAW